MLTQVFVVLCLLSAVSGALDSVIESSEPSASTTEAITKTYDSCITSTGEIGECVPTFQCLEDSEDENCASWNKVCCTPSQRIQPTSKPKPKREGCGWRDPDGIEIVGLKDNYPGYTKFAEIPWICAILKLNDTEDQKSAYISAGSLIHPSVVLTVALSVSTPSQLRVRCGEWDSVRDVEPYLSIERDVATVEVHPDFNKRKLFNDVALIFLAQPMPPVPHVGVACLPAPLAGVIERTECLGVGWGKDKFGKEGRYTNVLMKVERPTMNHSSCVETLQKTRLGPKFQLHESVTCAGAEDKSCIGDQGSPLSCPIEGQADRYVVHGAQSWALGCDNAFVYVSTAVVRSWVDEHVAKKGYNTSVYSF